MQIGVETSRAVENKRIFVVEDDEIVRAALQFMLHDENETHEIASIAAAYDKAVDWRPDLVLLGASIVEASPDVIGELKTRIEGVKVLLVVDNVRDEAARAATSRGADGVLSKPLTIEFVRQKVDILLGRRQPAMVQLGSLSLL